MRFRECRLSTLDWRAWTARLLELRQKRALRWGVSLALVLLFVAYVVYRFSGEWRQLARSQVSIDVSFVGVAVGLCGLNFAFFLIVWQGIVTFLGGTAGWRKNAEVYCYTYLARFMPTPIWFLAGRLHFSEQLGLRAKSGLQATGLEIGLHVVTAAGFYGLLQGIRSQRWWVALALALGLIVTWKLGLLRRIGLAGPGRVRYRDLGLWTVLYLMTWVVAGPFLQAVIRACVPFSISVWEAWRIWALSSLAGYAGFLLLGGMGFLCELSITALLTGYLLPGDALVVAAGTRLVLLASSVLWAACTVGLLRLLSLPRRSQRTERTADDE